MAKYYIDGDNGSDSNNGTTPTTPWQTVRKWRSAVMDVSGSVWGDTVVIMGNVYEPTGVLADFTSYAAANKGGVTFRQWVVADGLPSGGTTVDPGITKGIWWGAQPLTAIVSGGWSTAGAAGRRQITLTASTDIEVLAWRYGQNRDAAGRLYGHLYKCSADGSGAAADGLYDSGTNASGKRDGFYQTGTTLTIDSTFVGTPTTADFIAGYRLTTSPILSILRGDSCKVLGLEFRIASNRSTGAYAVSFDSCTNCVAEDCVAYDAGHHAFGVSNQSSVANSNTGFRRCVAMGLIGIDGSSTNCRGGFSLSVSTDITLGGTTFVEDCESHIYSLLSPQLRTDGTQLAYPTFRSSGDYSGTPSRFAACIGTGFPTTGGTPAYNVSGIIHRRTLFRMYRDAIGTSAAENLMIYGSNTNNVGNGQVGDPNLAETYPVRYEDCTFVDVGYIKTGATLNTSFKRCRFLQTQVQYNNQAALANSSGAIFVENYTNASRTWYTLFDTCDFVCSLNTSADDEAFWLWTNGTATKFDIRFINSRIGITNQKRPASAQDQSLFFMNQSGGVSGCSLTVKYSILGWFEPAKTNATNRLMRSDGSDLGTKAVFSGNAYRNITTGKWSYSNSGSDTAAEWLDRSTGVDKTGFHDKSVEGPYPNTWGGPLSGCSNPYALSNAALVPGTGAGYGLAGHAPSGVVGPWQNGSTVVLANKVRNRMV